MHRLKNLPRATDGDQQGITEGLKALVISFRIDQEFYKDEIKAYIDTVDELLETRPVLVIVPAADTRIALEESAGN